MYIAEFEVRHVFTISVCGSLTFILNLPYSLQVFRMCTIVKMFTKILTSEENHSPDPHNLPLPANLEDIILGKEV